MIQEKQKHNFDAVFDRCGICYLFQQLDIAEVIPALCAYDYTMAERTDLLGRGSFCLIPSNSRFEEFDKDVLRISQDYQFIRIGTEIYIKDLNVLEKFGGFKDIIKKEAREAVDNIELIGILEDTKGLRELLESDLTFARKLCKVGKYSPVLSLNIPNETIIRFSNEHPGIAGQLKYSADGEHIKLNTKKSQKIFVKLLEDSYLTSELTRLYYDSIAKEMCEV